MSRRCGHDAPYGERVRHEFTRLSWTAPAESPRGTDATPNHIGRSCCCGVLWDLAVAHHLSLSRQRNDNLPDLDSLSQQRISKLQQVRERLTECNSTATIFDAFDSGCRPIQEFALAQFKTLVTKRDCSGELQAALTSADDHVGVINAMVTIEPRAWTSGCNVRVLLRDALQTGKTTTQVAVARLICRQFPSQLPLLLESLSRPVARILCFHAARGDFTFDMVDALIRRMTSSMHQNLIPTFLGLAITPQWLAELSICNSLQAVELAEACGAVEPGMGEFPCEHLASGVCFVNRHLAVVPIEAIRHDMQSICHHLLALGGTLSSDRPAELQDGRSVDAMNLKHSLDQALYFAAVREYERQDLAARALRSPFCFNGLRDEASDAGLFLHLPARLLRERLIHDPVKTAESLSVPPELHTRFAFEFATMNLRPNDDQRTESSLYMHARWAAMRSATRWAVDEFQPVVTQNGNMRFPEAIVSVLRDHDLLSAVSGGQTIRLPSTPSEDVISTTAAACLRLMAILKHPELADVRTELQEGEKRLAPSLLPVGVEIQIPHVNDSNHVGWKELFRSVGISSPRRPECGRMLELALPPAVSWHAPCQFLRLVAELGIPSGAQDLAVHVSLQGDLGRIAGYLAFTQLFMNTSSFHSPRLKSGLRHVMSKGLVHLNRDVIQCRWTNPADCRTELRVVVARVIKVGGFLEIDHDALECIRQIQLIASASVSSAFECRTLAQQFVESLGSVVESYPPCLKDLMDANFYESTGDYRAVELLDSLRVLQLREAARMLTANQKAAFQKSSAELRSKLSDQIEAKMGS